MKTFYLIIFIILALSMQNLSFAQDEDCCEEDDKYGKEGELTDAEWYQQMDELTARKKGLEENINSYAKEIDELKAKLSSKASEVQTAENGLYSVLGMNKAGLEDFKKKFDETEKKILNRTGNPADARKYYFNDIAASKAKCLPDYWTRYVTMKQKLEQWEKESIAVVKEDKYTVIKGDCLWKISGKSEIYSNPKFWPKIWEANEDGVISAPAHTPKKVTNPNLIYPGQVLRIQKLTDEDLKKLVDNTYIMKNVRKIKEIEKDKKVVQKKKKNKTKEIKKVDKTKKKVTDDGKDIKKDIKK
jgi:nucleoid-associated protein YgaU